MQWIESLEQLMRRVRPSKYGWSGDYATWQMAEKQCSGYDAANILEKVKQSVLKVKQGEAVYERDSVIFDEVEYSWPLLSGLLWVAARLGGRLNVCDFGGSLGSSYFQNKKFLDPLENLSWNVVEQAGFVTCGREFIQDDLLKFFYTIDEAIAAGKPDILLLSCVLPYLRDPWGMLDQFMQYSFPYIILDNTYFNYEGRDRITIQKVYPSIYEASYPCWFLDYRKLLAFVERRYMVISEYVNDSIIFLDGRKIPYKGLLLKNKFA